MNSQDIVILTPEIVLAVFAMLGLLAGAYGGKDRTAPLMTWITAAVLALVGLWIAFSGGPAREAFGGMFVDDAFARFAKTTLLLSAAAVLVMSEGYMEKRDLLRFEYPLLVTLAAIGMMVMVSAGDLMVLYMGLELQSLALYVVAALRRDSARSTEAGLKYFVLGALSSGLLLYGASLTYGFAGTTLFDGILITAQEGEISLGLLFGLVFLMMGLAFKVSAVPFHMWTPDVYEGSPTPVTAFFATAPKVAAMGLFARLLFDAFGGIGAEWGQIVALIAVLSMFLGSVAAIGQTNIKRLMAYSSIAHMGFALMGLAAGTAAGVEAMLIYMAIYVTMNVGTFAFILSMERDGQPVTDLRSLGGYSKVDPVKALAVLVLMFSLAGVPPLLGFFAKLGVFRAAWASDVLDLSVMVVAAGIASVIGLYYYLRIVYLMYFGDETEPLDRTTQPIAWVMLMGAAFLMVAGIVNLFGVGGMAAIAADSLVR